jgi:thiol-disulfide isomerase/thioredoxin
VQARRSESKRLHGLDRLPALSLCALLLAPAGCDEGAKGTPAPGRVVAVSQAKQQVSESELCDVLKPAQGAPRFEYPALRAAPPAPGGGYRWVNVWATWCPPCIEELPLLGRFRDKLQQDGAKVELVLLSVDQSPEPVEKFAAQHPEVRGSLQIKDSAGLEPWLAKVGLDSGATLPIHLFVDPAGKVRCARTGALRESDLAAVKKLLL